MKSDFIWMDGELIPYEQATVHFITPTLHYGIGVFEGIRCYQTPQGPAIFRLTEHLKRFLESIHILGINLPYSVEDMRHAVHETIRANNFKECYIRPLMYMQGPLTLNTDNSQARLGIATWEWGQFLGEFTQKTSIHLMVSSFTRLHPNINLTKAKVSGNYVNSMLVKTLALRSGYDEAVILDPEGFVAECTGENIFVLRKGILYTPPLAIVLEGITRASIISLASDIGLQVKEEMLTRDELYIADEVFICGTAAEIVGAGKIDHRSIGLGGIGPITQTLQQAYHDNTHGTGIHSGEWLDYLNK